MVTPARAAKRATKTAVTTPLPSIEEMEAGFRRRSDEILWQVLQERFGNINTDLAEVTRALHGYNGEPGLLGRMQAMEGQLVMLVQLVNAALAAKEPAAKEDDDKPLTKAKLAEMAVKFFAPVLTAVLIWLLLTFFPNALVHIGP